MEKLPSRLPAPYTVQLEDKHWKALEALPQPSQQEKAISFLTQYLPQTPKKLLPNGALKELHGEHKGIWQFDIDRSYRILYTVDEGAHEVNIEYIGSHPGWGRNSSGKRRIKQ